MHDLWPLYRDVLHYVFGWCGTITSTLIGVVVYYAQMKKIKKGADVKNISATIAVIPFVSSSIWLAFALTFPLGMNMFFMTLANLPAVINTWRMGKLLKKHGKGNLLKESCREISVIVKELFKK